MPNPVVMVVRTGNAMTRRCVGSLITQDIDGGVELVMADNGADDGTSHFLRTLPGVLVSYRPAANLHKVWNRLIRHAFVSMRAEHVLVVNNDTWLRPDTYRLLVASRHAFVTGVSVGTMAEATSHADPASSSPHPSFSCFLLRRAVWERVGEFDERYHIYAGDNQYHVRMHRAGVEACAIDVPFFHEVSGTIKQLPFDEAERIRKQADADREVFKAEFGCMPWEPGYAELFR